MFHLYALTSLTDIFQQAVATSALIWIVLFLVVVFVVWLLITIAARQKPDVIVTYHEGHEHSKSDQSKHVPIGETPEPISVAELKPEPETESKPETQASDNLVVLEGIGPKVNSLLKAAGITTFSQLAETDVNKLNEILDANKLQMIDPTSWPAQARLAAEGKFVQLQALQDELKGGRKMPENLTDLEGIGPKVNSLLHEAGVTTFAQLARTDIQRLKDLLEANKLQMIDPTSWPEQARLVVEGKPDELQALQDKLKGGRMK